MCHKTICDLAASQPWSSNEVLTALQMIPSHSSLAAKSMMESGDEVGMVEMHLTDWHNSRIWSGGIARQRLLDKTYEFVYTLAPLYD